MRNNSADLKFNRIRNGKQHTYLKEYVGGRYSGDEQYDGYIKCKLVHNKLYSLVIPDQVFVGLGGALHWIQPLYFSGCFIAQYKDHGTCQLSVDISHGVVLNIQFNKGDFLSKFDDASFLYKCEIKGPKYLYRYTTGTSKLVRNKPFLKLHHHTSHEAKMGISKSREFWTSDWNIQGTKKTTNISFLYMTALPSITCFEDLCEIAMSSDGKLAFRVDQNNTDIPDLILDVYRESTENRTESLSYWVDATLLSTQSFYRHLIPGGVGYHEVVSPFIQRIGVESNTVVQICGDKLRPCSPKGFDYVVVGDAATLSGLAAPYDEEDTKEIFKIERIGDTEDIIGFWIANGNTNQYDGKDIEIAEFN